MRRCRCHYRMRRTCKAGNSTPWAPRAFNGVALYRLSQANPPGLARGRRGGSRPAVGDVQGVQRALVAWVDATFGHRASGSRVLAARSSRVFGATHGMPTTAPTRVDRGDAARCSRCRVVAHPELEGALEWYALEARAIAQLRPLRVRPSEFRKSLLPIHVGFRGMPNAAGGISSRAARPIMAIASRPARGRRSSCGDELHARPRQRWFASFRWSRTSVRSRGIEPSWSPTCSATSSTYRPRRGRRPCGRALDLFTCSRPGATEVRPQPGSASHRRRRPCSSDASKRSGSSATRWPTWSGPSSAR